VKRSARLALDLVTPQRALAPLKALDLPRDLVRQGLEKVRDLGLRIGQAAGRHLGQDLNLLTQMMLRPIRSVIQKMTQGEPSLELTLGPKRGIRLDR
jgi:hypothetical protein